MSVFDRYAPFIQDFIYDHEWESLRGIQVAAGEAIFNTEDHVLLTAQTASGKTEAAFFPILTEFWENPPASVGAIYIGPTKALINDQFFRLTDLCEEADIPVWHWHGDVSASHKAKLIKKPSGILQLTPESLEAILMRRHSAVARLFCDLRYVVIDEVHSLLRGDRGGQCLCLIERLSRMAGVDPRRIGLSATIGDPEAVGAFLAAGHAAADEVQAAGADLLLAADGVREVGVAGVDDDVTRLHEVGERVDHGVGRLTGLDHDDGGARLDEAVHEFLKRLRRIELAFAAMLVHELLGTRVVAVEQRHRVAMVRQITRQIGAHRGQSNHTNVCCSFGHVPCLSFDCPIVITRVTKQRISGGNHSFNA